ncbi:MAG: squalene/phytoene synthase family protein [Pseudomonadota bacterium]
MADGGAQPLLERLAPLPAPIGSDPAAAAAAITRAAGSSFGPGMRALPKPRREAMWALYAFARVVDDIADEPMPQSERHRLLDLWRAEIAALYAGHPRSLIGQALAGPVEAYALPQQEFLLLIEGMEMDAAGPVVAPSMRDLRAYTRRVAGTIGMLSMRNFGAWRGAVSARFALALADALQLTNILRDVEEDAAIGRLYLPRELLDRHAIPAEPEAAARDKALPALSLELGRLARAEFDAARAAIPAHDRRSLTPALMMMGVYENVLNRLVSRGFVAGPRVRLSKGAKLRAAFTAVLAPSALRPSDG